MTAIAEQANLDKDDIAEIRARVRAAHESDADDAADGDE